MTDEATAMPLSFPPSIYATVSPAAFLHANLTSPNSKRANGRQSNECRKPTINTNSLRHCFGSAVVRTGHTAVVCGIRGEVLRAEDAANAPQVDLNNEDQDESDELKLLVPNIEMATGASPAFLPGNPPSTLAQSLSQRMYSLLHGVRLVDVRDLRILYQAPKSMEDEAEELGEELEIEIKAYWTLYIDILFISLDGNAFDAAWAAMLAALRNTKLPKAWWDPDLENVICSEKLADATALRLRGLPVPATFAVFDPRRNKGTGEVEQQWVFADPDSLEEDVCDEAVTIVVDGAKIRRIEKSGGTILDKDEIQTLVRATLERWKEWHDILRSSGG